MGFLSHRNCLGIKLIKCGRQLLGIETVLLEGFGVPPVQVGAEVPRVPVDAVVTVVGVGVNAALDICVDGCRVSLLEVHDLVGFEELPREVRRYVNDIGQLSSGGLLLDFLLIALAWLVNPLDRCSGMFLLKGLDELLEVGRELFVLERPGLELDAAFELGGRVNRCLTRRFVA